MGKPLVSIVCPVFNEEDLIRPFYERLTDVISKIESCEFEIIFTNNRSSDRTEERILELRQQDPRVQLLTFSRNYGYQYSVLAGMRQAAGDAIVAIDVDCEDPPSLIAQFIERWQEGYDVVYGERDRRDEIFLITWCRKIFYRLNRLVADSDIILDMAEFALITADVRDAVVAATNTFPFLRAEIAHYGFKRTGIRYDRQPRIGGRTHYGFIGMAQFAIGGILASTTLPLRMAMYLLPIVLFVSAVCLGAAIGMSAPWAMDVLIAVNLAYLSTAIAFLSLYLARAYRNISTRPIVIDWGHSATNKPRDTSPNAVKRLWRST